MSVLAQFAKDPLAVLDYTVDWSLWLPTGDSISTFTVTASAGITVNSSSNTNSTVTAWVQGGVAATPYTVTYLITTAQGRTDERTIILNVQNR